MNVKTQKKHIAVIHKKTKWLVCFITHLKTYPEKSNEEIGKEGNFPHNNKKH